MVIMSSQIKQLQTSNQGDTSNWENERVHIGDVCSLVYITMSSPQILNDGLL